MKKKIFTDRDRRDAEGSKMDNPENLETDKEGIYEMDDDSQFVDSIPLEDLKMEEQEEKDKHATKQDSSSEDRFPG